MQANVIIKTLVIIILSYLVGSFNPSYFLAKMHGYDIRTQGSKNAGASNVLIMMGKKAGIIVAIFDILKAFVVVNCTLHYCNSDVFFGAVSATSVMLGHIFPFYMGFRGGKGFATLGGSILAFSPKLFLILLILAIIIVFTTNYICFAPMSISVIFAIICGIIYKSWPGALVLLIAAIAINFRHIENIERIKEGTEARFSLLWNRKGEADRLGKEYDGGKGYETVSADILNGKKENN